MLFAHFQNCSVGGKEKKNTQEQEGCRALGVRYFGACIQVSCSFVFNVELVIYYDGMVGRLYQL